MAVGALGAQLPKINFGWLKKQFGKVAKWNSFEAFEGSAQGRVHSSTKNMGNTSLVPDPQKINAALLLYIVRTKSMRKTKGKHRFPFGLGTKTFQKQKKTNIWICCKSWCRNIQRKKKYLSLYEYTHMYISIFFHIVLCWGLGENAPNLTKYCACAQI